MYTVMYRVLAIIFLIFAGVLAHSENWEPATYWLVFSLYMAYLGDTRDS